MEETFFLHFLVMGREMNTSSHGSINEFLEYYYKIAFRDFYFSVSLSLLQTNIFQIFLQSLIGLEIYLAFAIPIQPIA